MLPFSDELTETLYAALHERARRHLRRFPGATLEPSELVNEVYLRLQHDPARRWESRTHFFRTAARAMRFFLVDHAKRKAALKHGGEFVRVSMNVTLPGHAAPVALEEVASITRSLSRLQREYPEHAEIALLRYFAGCTVAEIAELLGIAVRTVERRWRFAAARLRTWTQEQASY
ncbi:ECF-type sigma factor [Haliangium ochraceum]|uniref:RNA polymerase, sigma-24 subunit, ECF subfamily n=1 Tax=Haliangium ochraceum (strain DSM 14365 / JCM 11303 / SMP-2) TaxID=502025 RepID=D0LGY0_HALO1|nr:ECF-type sigma factor [Haliangium ochraceum]ACY14702.1 RNA polymerase, sigma-24 subunit, ECF subfamily [Haliangium ochraceum DSM 14365]